MSDKLKGSVTSKTRIILAIITAASMIIIAIPRFLQVDEDEAFERYGADQILIETSLEQNEDLRQEIRDLRSLIKEMNVDLTDLRRELTRLNTENRMLKKQIEEYSN